MRTYDRALPFSGWLFGIASHHCVDLLRRRRLEGRLFEPAEIEAVEVVSGGPAPLGELLAAEQRTPVRAALAALPERYRVPLVLRYYNELSYDEIAAMLVLTRNHVATLIFRAKKELRQKIEAQKSKRGGRMKCFPELIYAIFADGELPSEDAFRVERHLAACPRCRMLVEALLRENRFLAEVLRGTEEELPVTAASSRKQRWQYRGQCRT